MVALPCYRSRHTPRLPSHCAQGEGLGVRVIQETTMTALESTLRKQLERTVVRAREKAEEGAAAVLQTLAVREREAHPTMDQAQRDLRTALRAKAKNLGEGD